MREKSFFDSSNFDSQPIQNQGRVKNAWLAVPFWILMQVFAFRTGLFSFSHGAFRTFVSVLMIVFSICVSIWIYFVWNRKTDLYNGEAFSIPFDNVDLTNVKTATISFPNESIPLVSKFISVEFIFKNGTSKKTLIPVTDDDIFKMRKNMKDTLERSGIEVQIVSSF